VDSEMTFSHSLLIRTAMRIEPRQCVSMRSWQLHKEESQSWLKNYKLLGKIRSLIAVSRDRQNMRRSVKQFALLCRTVRMGKQGETI
jgi:hypothetical protein